MEAILTVNNLKTTFLTGSGAVQAVRGISFQVGKGEIVGIVGESGSGKSVSSMSILRLLPGTAVAATQLTAASTWLTRKGPQYRLSIRSPSMMARPRPYQAT